MNLCDKNWVESGEINSVYMYEFTHVTEAHFLRQNC